MEKIKLKNIKIYAYHGCLEEESKIGSFYLINLTVSANLKKAGTTDDLEDTVNYAKLTQIVKEEMNIRSNLLENIACRILSSIETRFKSIQKAKVSVSKLNPPINVNSEEVKITFKRNFHRNLD